jgi:hypothetical protein
MILLLEGLAGISVLVFRPTAYTRNCRNSSGYYHRGGGTSILRILGNKLTPDEARKSPLLNDFFAVADYAIDNDPAVRTYLSGVEINLAGRICKH